MRQPSLPPADRPPPLRLRVASRSHPGCERARNEDSLLVASFPTGAVMAVCDGMGGHAGGAEASRCAVDTLEQVLLGLRAPADRDELGRRLLGAVTEASRRVLAMAARHPELRGMGSTATVCGLLGEHLVVAQVGDSRAYLLRAGRLTQLTRDQTLVTLMVEQGQLPPEDAKRVDFGHVILQAVGSAGGVDVDLRAVRVCDGDVLLVCSDGLSGPVDDSHIRRVLSAETDCARAAEALIALAIDAGGPDNVTCIVARVLGGRSPEIEDDPVVDRLYLPADPIGELPPGARESLIDRMRPTTPEGTGGVRRAR